MASMTTGSGDCGCGGGCGGGTATSGSGTGARGGIERPRFFPRQLITPDDLTLGQDYFRDRLRRMNRYLHGWGVVCGARVEASTQAWRVVVQPGYLLGPQGDEIMIERDVCFDLRTRCVSAVSGDACDDIAIDPLCPDRTVSTRDPGAPLFVAVRYRQVAARPVRVQPVGCGCDDTGCEFSRWQDGYELCVLDACPESHASPPSMAQFTEPGAIPDCPPCPTDPWVVLAKVTVDEQGKVSAPDNCACRRQLRTTGPYWWNCNEGTRSETQPGSATEAGTKAETKAKADPARPA